MQNYNNIMEKHINKGVIVDSNLLLLYFIGTANLNVIKSFKRTAKYSPEDYHILCKFMKCFKTIISTPNILTEVYNLFKDSKNVGNKVFYQVFLNIFLKKDEKYIRSETAIKDILFEKVGLTDSVIALLSKEDYLILTDDLKLFGILEDKKYDVINFNHLRYF